MEKLVHEGLTPHGKDFLIAALDPMHDTQLRELSGWPDVETSSSIAMAVKQSVTISSTTTTNWDLHVVQWPWFTALQYVGATRANNYLQMGNSNPGQTFAFGGLCAYIVPTGQPLNLSAAPDFMLNLPDTYSGGAMRALGVGFEVVNTTAEIYKQGQCAVWRQPNGSFEPDLYQATYGYAGGGSIVGNRTISAHIISSPPRTFATAMLVPGTRQWKAAEGCYVVVPHMSAENPPKLVNYVQPIVFQTESDDHTANMPNPQTTAPPTPNISFMLAPTMGFQVAASYANQGCRTFPIHQCGAMFTGLSPQTTLTMTWNVYIERFPTVAEPEILVLARPSASYDMLALKLYSEALLSLPIGVPASENGFGDWFAGVVKKVSDWLSPVATAAGFPVLGGVAHLAGQAANAYLTPNTPHTRPTMARISKPLPPRPPPKPKKKALPPATPKLKR